MQSLVLGPEISMKAPTKIKNFASLSMIYDRNALLVLLVFIFSENKIVAWVVLVAEFVQQTFFPTTKINYFCFNFSSFSSWLRPKVLGGENSFKPDQTGLNPMYDM